jgi:CheY-like chemotaxis protein
MGMRILVVDDDGYTREVLVLFLEMEGHSVASCETGAQALQHLGRQRFEVLLTDYMMPSMTGLELTRRARELQRDLHCIVITGLARPTGHELEPVIWLGKPFAADTLLSALQSRDLCESAL